MAKSPTLTRPAIHAFASTLKTFKTASGKTGKFYSLPALARQFPKVARLPVSLRIVLESVLRNCDGKKVTAAHVGELANWLPNAGRAEEIPFVVSRVVLQDFTGVPLLADLAAMRSVAVRLGKTRNRSSRWCRWILWWTTPSWWTTTVKRIRWT
jgi:aconitate hydratase